MRQGAASNRPPTIASLAGAVRSGRPMAGQGTRDRPGSPVQVRPTRTTGPSPPVIVGSHDLDTPMLAPDSSDPHAIRVEPMRAVTFARWLLNTSKSGCTPRPILVA